MSRFARVRAALTPAEWRRAGVLALVILALHVVGFFILFALVVPEQLRARRGGVFGIGLGLTAYTLGMRHAFDADHIAAIDNTTRRLMSDGRRPVASASSSRSGTRRSSSCSPLSRSACGG